MGTEPNAVPGSEPPLVRVSPPGPMSRSWLTRLSRFESQMAFESADTDEPIIVYASALGCNVVDVDGNRYVDLAAGFGALLLGHLAQRPARALEMQSHRLWTALGDVFPSDAKIAMLERVAGLYPAPGARALLCQSGSDAITAAIKTATLYTGRAGVVAFEGAYHGLGYGPLAACGYRDSFRQPFAAQLNPQVSFAPYPCDESELQASLSHVRKCLESHTFGAVLVEPILGRGGCVVPPAAFLPELVSLAHANGALLIADEIWTGLGRCGSMLACSQVGAVADIVCFGKGLGGGLPISACVAPDSIMQAWKSTPGVVHTSTFQGNALACSTGVATIDAIKFGKLAERASELGCRFLDQLRGALSGNPLVRKVTGAGLMIGIALDSGTTAEALRRVLLAKGYLLVAGGADGSVLTLTPPLTIPEELLEGFTATFADVVDERARA